MNTDTTTTNQPSLPKHKPRWLPCHPYLLLLLVSIPIFHYINKLFLVLYFGNTSQTYEDIEPQFNLFLAYQYGRHSQSYADFEPQINLGLILIEIMFLLFIFWLSKRRWYQYSLRTLLIFVTLFAVACSWFAVNMQEAKKQREAVEAIEKKGKFFVSYDQTSNYIIRLLAYYFGDDFCYAIDISERGAVTDADLQSLKAITHLNKLSLFQNTNITDVGLYHLKGLSKLRSLDLYCCTNITDAGLIHLQGLTHLDELDLNGTKITDDGLKNLISLSNLRTLRLNGTNITGDGFVYFKGLKHIEHLYLWDSKINDDGLKQIKILRNLYYLNLRNTMITDDGLRQLKDLCKLRTLILGETNISDAGLAHLKGMKQLDKLVIDKTNVTNDGVQVIEKALPKLKIYRERNINSYSED
jgi:hypothetical protein